MGMDFPADEAKAILEQAKQVVEIVLSLTSTELLSNIKEETPVDKDKLRGAWNSEQISELSYRMYNNTEYALAVHDGAKAHLIEAKHTITTKRGKTIQGYLFWNGASHPIRSVMHPGYGGNPFTEPAIQTTEARLDEFTQIALQQTGAT